MFKLSEKTIKAIEETTGITYEQIQTLDDEEIQKIIEKKTGKKITFGKVKQMGSGDDSVLIDRGRIRTIEEVDKKIEELIK